jgi:alkanesulfonate monooxygenase SsuD/methylene tetrahydromethanopterin reductase-like flavin-dependent oxidoreductase (luciferase family)
MKFDLAVLATHPAREIVRQAQLAEALGYDTVWMTDEEVMARVG